MKVSARSRCTGVRSEGSLSSKLLMCSNGSPEGEGDGSKADASRVAAATEDAWQSVPLACAIAGGGTGGSDGAESPNREEAHQASLSMLNESERSQPEPERHWTGSAVLNNEFAKSLAALGELLRTRATSRLCESLNRVLAAMSPGPRLWGSIAQSPGGRGKPSSSIRMGTLASCLAGIVQF